MGLEEKEMITRFKPLLGLTFIFVLILAMACGGDATATPSPTQTPAASATSEPPPPIVSTDYSSVTAELSRQIQGIVDATGITGLSVALVDD